MWGTVQEKDRGAWAGAKVLEGQESKGLRDMKMPNGLHKVWF